MNFQIVSVLSGRSFEKHKWQNTRKHELISQWNSMPNLITPPIHKFVNLERDFWSAHTQKRKSFSVSTVLRLGENVQLKKRIKLLDRNCQSTPKLPGVLSFDLRAAVKMPFSISVQPTWCFSAHQKKISEKAHVRELTVYYSTSWS